MNNELMVIEEESTAIYAGRPIDRDLVVEFADTLMGVHPSAQEVGVKGMRTVAQLALVTGANPLPGTNGIHAWRDKKGNICIQFGVGFWRTQAELEGGRLWIFRPRPMDDQEREYYGVIKGQVASICSGALKRDVFDLLRDARAMGIEMSIKEAKSEVGCVGIGIVNPGEYDANGRNKQWKADLRAERDLLRQLVPVMQRARQNLVNGTHVRGGLDWSAGEYAHLTDGEELPEDYDADDANADLFGDVVEAEYSEPQPEPEAQVSNGNGNRKPTAAMLKDLHVSGTKVFGKKWDTKRAEISETFGKSSSKDWSLDEYFEIMRNLNEQLEAEQVPQEV